MMPWAHSRCWTGSLLSCLGKTLGPCGGLASRSWDLESALVPGAFESSPHGCQNALQKLFWLHLRGQSQKLHESSTYKSVTFSSDARLLYAAKYERAMMHCEAWRKNIFLCDALNTRASCEPFYVIVCVLSFVALVVCSLGAGIMLTGENAVGKWLASPSGHTQ